MKRQLFVMTMIVFGVALVLQSAHADGLRKRHHAKPECEPGYKLVEEVVYQEVTRAVCKMVPETKKKWVYSWIDDPFCVHDTRHGDCPHCAGPYCRKQLVKRQVDVPCPGMKCVTELITERVPVVRYRKVPIDAELIPVKPNPAKE